MTGSLSAKIIANFTEDFDASEAVGGWSYLWNPTGVEIGEHQRYQALEQLRRSPRLVANGQHKNGKDNPTPNATYLRIEAGSLTPGNAAARATDALDHYAVLAYTIQPGEAGVVSIVNSRIRMSENAREGASAKIIIYVGDVVIGEDTLGLGGASAFDVPLGQVDVGETIYVALGPGATRSTGMKIQFQIAAE